MTTLILIRHGETSYNSGRCFTGQRDIPMSPHGLLQVQKTAEHVIANYRVDAVYSSDLERAHQTVLPIALHFGLSVTTMRDLRETDVGAWQDRSIADIQAKEPALFALYQNEPDRFRFPNGENRADVQHRALRAVRRIVAEQEGKTVAVGAHGGLIHALCRALLERSDNGGSRLPIIRNASLTVVELDGDKARFLRIADDDHLRELNESVLDHRVI